MDWAEQNEIVDQAKRIRFMLNGCDISFVAEAPEDITLKQLLKQCDRMKPDWCACGIRSLDDNEEKFLQTEIIINYDDIQKTGELVPCKIFEEKVKDIYL